MVFDFAVLKQLCRQQLHDTLAVAASYSHPSLISPVDVGVRWSDGIKQFGDLQAGDGYAEITEGIQRLVFDRGELAAKGLVLARGGIVQIPQYQITITLELRQPYDGPVNEVWQVT